MAFIGNTPTAVPLTGSQIADGTIVNANIATNTINLTQKVTATLPYAQGGTGLSTLGTAGQALIVNSSATALSYATVGATAGQVIQVLSTTKTDTFSVAGTTSLVDITNFSVSITPSSASNKILITGFIGSAIGPDSNQTFFHLIRGATEIAKGDTDGSRQFCHTSAVGNGGTFNSGTWILTPVPFQYLDSPSTTSAITYKIQLSGATASNTHYINRSIRDEASTYYDGRIVSTITVMEVKG